MCPLSNLKLRVVNDLAHHPLHRFMGKDVIVTVNSDDPAYFGGYMNANFEQTVQALDLGREDVVQLARNSVEASFVSEQRKREMFDRIAACSAG